MQDKEIVMAMTLFSALVRGIGRPSIGLAKPPLVTNLIDNFQSRSFAWTKTKRRREEKKAKKAANLARGILPPKPNRYMPRDLPVINAVSRDVRDAEARNADLVASQELHKRMVEKEADPEPLRFSFTGLTMSDRVRKVFNLSNASQKEVVSVQKKRGMELFQLREGDTGSSAVQVIALTTRIQQLQTHVKTHRKDQHCKRGMAALYVRRRKLLDYMERKDFESFRRVVKTLGLVR